MLCLCTVGRTYTVVTWLEACFQGLGASNDRRTCGSGLLRKPKGCRNRRLSEWSQPDGTCLKLCDMHAATSDALPGTIFALRIPMEALSEQKAVLEIINLDEHFLSSTYSLSLNDHRPHDTIGTDAFRST